MISKALALGVLAIGSIALLTPLVWMLSASLKPAGQVMVFPPVWIPTERVLVTIGQKEFPLVDVPIEGQVRRLALVDKQKTVGIFADPSNPSSTYKAPYATAVFVNRVHFRWENYSEALTMVPFGTYARNSVTVTFVGMFGTLLSSSLVAYGFARFRAPGLNFLFLLLLSTTMLPRQVTLIPVYLLFSRLGWVDTLKPLIVPTFFANAYDVFLLRQFFMTIPMEMDEAARMEGAGTFTIFFRILLPLARPAVAAVAIFHFMWAWNDFFDPLIYLQHAEHYTIALGLQFFNALHTQNTHLLMAASVTTVLPCVLLFFFAQRTFIQGIVISGVKG